MAPDYPRNRGRVFSEDGEVDGVERPAPGALDPEVGAEWTNGYEVREDPGVDSKAGGLVRGR
jgi:hypothetical protein